MAARSLRERWALGERPISNIVHLLEAKGIRIFTLVESTKNVDAFSLWRSQRPFIFLNTSRPRNGAAMTLLMSLVIWYCMGMGPPLGGGQKMKPTTLLRRSSCRRPMYWRQSLPRKA